MGPTEILHGLELKIALEIKRVCDECNIKFFLFNGTLLGAARHKGFIPWDDDMDVAMPREEYEKFIRVFPEHADTSTFFLENWNTEDCFGLPFSKVKLNGTVYMEHSAKNTDTHKGIFVDVFPLDYLPDDRAVVEKTARKLGLLVKIHKFGLGYLPTDPNNRRQYYLSKVMGAVGRLIPKSYMRKKIIREATRYNGDENVRCLAALAGNGNHYKCLIDEKWIENIITVPFESEMMPVPAGYDEILTSLYGDYMQLPPVEQRVYKHNPEMIYFGIYA